MRYGVFGHITEFIDLPQVAFWVFFLFFLALVWYNRRWDKLEGYPMKASPFNSQALDGFPVRPAKDEVYILNEGGTTTAPHFFEPGDVSAKPLYRFDGTPFTPVGNPLLAGIGPGAWVKRKDEPALTEHGDLLLRPARLMPEWSVGKDDADPRGMTVFDRRWNEIGVVHDFWIDRGIKIIRILEVDLNPGIAPGRVLVPIYHTVIKEKQREIRVTALQKFQFAAVPMPGQPDRITAQEDERLNAYFAAGYFYRDSADLEYPVETQR